MSRLRLPLLLIALAIAGMLLYAACGDDDKEEEDGGGDDGGVEVTLLPVGEYPATVTGAIEFTLPEESVSAAVVGPQTSTAELSGTATLKMGADGSFEIPEWGISGNFSEGGETQTIEMKDSSAEPTEGVTTADGSTGDLYTDVTVGTSAGPVTGTNTDTIGLTGDPLLNTTGSANFEMNNTAPVDVVDANNEPIMTVHALAFLFDLEPDDADGAGDGDGEGNGDVDGDGADADGAPFALVTELVGCLHRGPGDSVVQKLMTVTDAPASQNRQPGSEGFLVVSLVDEGMAPRAGGFPALGTGEPVVGATVTVEASGAGLLPGEESKRAVTNAEGEARAEFSINKFGEYELTVVEVAASDGTRYEFDPASQLSETFTVGETCESPEGW
ncbi:MAG: hypothetical protein WD379_01470 [Dehalococcoidia bacterium]